MGQIIINADDFGYTESCTNAIAEAFTDKMISSTTAMANSDYIEEASRLAAENGFLDKVGIHINLTYGIPLTEKIKRDPFFCNDGKFHNKIDRHKRLTKEQVEEVKDEVNAQIKRLKDMGFALTHADSHHHIHNAIFVLQPIVACLSDAGITKIRLHRNIGNISLYKRILKQMYNRRLRAMGFKTTEKMGGLTDILEASTLPTKFSCEIMVHPDFDALGNLIDRKDKINEVAVGEKLERIVPYISGGNVISYKDL